MYGYSCEHAFLEALLQGKRTKSQAIFATLRIEDSSQLRCGFFDYNIAFLPEEPHQQHPLDIAEITRPDTVQIRPDRHRLLFVSTAVPRYQIIPRRPVVACQRFYDPTVKAQNFDARSHFFGAGYLKPDVCHLPERVRITLQTIFPRP